MISSIRPRLLHLTFALFFAPALAFSQTQQTDTPFGSIGGRLKVGHVAEVVHNSGLTVRGKVVEITPSRLVLTGGAGTQTFTGTDVTAIRRTGPIWDGAVKGAIIGVLPIVILATNCHDCGLAPAGAMFAAIGAGIGVGIDAMFGPRTVYRSGQPPSRTVRLIPLLNRERKGLSAAISF